MEDRKIEKRGRSTDEDLFLSLDEKDTGGTRERVSRQKTSVRKASVDRRSTGRAAAVMRRKRRKKDLRRRMIAYGMRAACVLVAVLLVILIFSKLTGNSDGRQNVTANSSLPNYISESLLSINPHSRPGTGVTKISAVVIHSSDTVGQTAEEVRDSYEALGESGNRNQSSNFVLGSDGKGLLCVPVGEIAYASNGRNTDSVSVTYCYDTYDQSITTEAYDSLVDLTAWICGKYHVSRDQILRHSDVSGKKCPKYFVENSAVWEQFLDDVEKKLTDQGRMWSGFEGSSEESTEEEE